jgi:hypothetical protein
MNKQRVFCFTVSCLFSEYWYFDVGMWILLVFIMEYDLVCEVMVGFFLFQNMYEYVENIHMDWFSKIILSSNQKPTG